MISWRSSRKRQLVRQQLFEGQAALRRVMAAQQLAEVRIARRPMHHRERIEQATAVRDRASIAGGIQSRMPERSVSRSASSISERSRVWGTPSVVG